MPEKPILNRRERKVLAKFLSELANSPDTPPVIYESVANLTIWFGQYLDMNSKEIIEKCLEGYARRPKLRLIKSRNLSLIG